MGTQLSRVMTFLWENSGAEDEEVDEEEEEVDDEEVDATAEAAGSGSRPLVGGQVSGPAAPCSASPAAACSDSWVGEEGGEGRDFFLLEDSSLRRLFFSFCGRQQQQKRVIGQRSSTTSPRRLNTDATPG